MSTRRRLIVILAILASVLAIILGVSVLTRQDPRLKVATAFINDIAANKAQASYALASTGFQTTTDITTWQNDVTLLSQSYHGQPKLVSQALLSVSGQQTGSYKLVFSEQGSGTTTFQVELYVAPVSGGWQVSYFNSVPQSG